MFDILSNVNVVKLDEATVVSTEVQNHYDVYIHIECGLTRNALEGRDFYYGLNFIKPIASYNKVLLQSLVARLLPEGVTLINSKGVAQFNSALKSSALFEWCGTWGDILYNPNSIIMDDDIDWDFGGDYD